MTGQHSRGGRRYVAQGDAFSQAVRQGQGPRSVEACTHPRTGRPYFRRVPVEACRILSLDLTCPFCQQRHRTLYGAPFDHQGAAVLTWGCRACLGLTSRHRQGHRSPRWAAAVVMGDLTSRRGRPFTEGTHQRAAAVVKGVEARMRKMFRL